MKAATPSPAVLLRLGAGVLFLGALAVAPLVAGMLDASWGPATPAGSALTLVLLAAAALRLGARRLGKERERLATLVDLPVALLVAATLLSALFSVNRHASIIELLRLLSCVAAFYLGVEMGDGRREMGDGRRGEGETGRRGEHGTADGETGRRGDGGRRKRKGRERRDAGVTQGPRSEALLWQSAGSLVFEHGGTLLWGALLFGSAWAAARGVQEYLAALREGLSAWRVFGGFSHPSTLIAHLGLTMPLIAAAAVSLRARKDPLGSTWPVPALVLLLAAAAATFTGSRLGILALGLGFLVFVLAYLAAHRSVTPVQAAAIAVGFVLVGAAAIVAVPVLRERFLAALSGAEAFSLRFRFTTWAAAGRVFLSHPLAGSGAGTFASIMTRYSETSYSQTAHNHFVQTAAETGIAGIGALVAFLALWLAAVVRAIRGGTGDGGRGTGPQTGRREDGETGGLAPGDPAISSISSTPDRAQSAGRPEQARGSGHGQETGPNRTGETGPNRTGETGPSGNHPTSPPPQHSHTLILPHSHTPILPHSRAAFLAAAVGGVTASAAYAFVDFGWSIPATGWALWALLGAGLAMAGGVRRVPARAGAEALALVALCTALVPGAAVFLGSKHYTRAMAVKHREPMAAAGEFAESLRFDPYSPDTHRELGRTLGGAGLASGDRGRIEEGLGHLERAVRLAPTAGINAYHLGLLAMRAGESERAASALRHALACDPNNPPTWRQYGSLFEKTRPEETLNAACRLLEVESGIYAATNPLGQHVEPNYAFGHAWIADEKRRSGDRAGARTEYGKALAILERYRESKKGIAGIGPDGQRSDEVEPEYQQLESAVRRKLAAG